MLEMHRCLARPPRHWGGLSCETNWTSLYRSLILLGQSARIRTVRVGLPKSRRLLVSFCSPQCAATARPHVFCDKYGCRFMTSLGFHRRQTPQCFAIRSLYMSNSADIKRPIPGHPWLTPFHFHNQSKRGHLNTTVPLAQTSQALARWATSINDQLFGDSIRY